MTTQQAVPRPRRPKNAPVEPGERLPHEPSRQYQAFVAYRDLPFPRSIRKLELVIRFHNHGLLKQWFDAFRWEARVSEWDDHLDQVKRQKRIALLEAAEERNLAIATDLIKKGQEALGKVKSAKMSRLDLLRFLDAGIKLEREIIGDPKAEEQVHGPEQQTFTITIGPPLARNEAVPQLTAGQPEDDVLDADYTIDDDAD